MMFNNIFIVLLLTLFYYANAQWSCTTPNGEDAVCIDINHCPVFADVLRRKIFDPQVQNFMKESVCGFTNNKTPIICCGSTATYGPVENHPDTLDTGEFNSFKPGSSGYEDDYSYENGNSGQFGNQGGRPGGNRPGGFPDYDYDSGLGNQGAFRPGQPNRPNWPGNNFGDGSRPGGFNGGNNGGFGQNGGFNGGNNGGFGQDYDYNNNGGNGGFRPDGGFNQNRPNGNNGGFGPNGGGFNQNRPNGNNGGFGPNGGFNQNRPNGNNGGFGPNGGGFNQNRPNGNNGGFGPNGGFNQNRPNGNNGGFGQNGGGFNQNRPNGNNGGFGQNDGFNTNRPGGNNGGGFNGNNNNGFGQEDDEFDNTQGSRPGGNTAGSRPEDNINVSRPNGGGSSNSGGNTTSALLNFAQLLKLLPTREECGESTENDRIIGGVETDIGEYPWMALLQYKSRYGVLQKGFACGGALINKRYVITAAHCVVGAIQEVIGSIAQVRLGEWDTKTEIDCPGKGNCNEGPLDIAVEKYIAHEGYLKNGNQNGNRHHDIAILRLAKPVEYTEFIRPICLPTEGEKGKPGDKVSVAGWGSIVPDKVVTSNKKMKVGLEIFPQNSCAEVFKRNNQVNIVDTQICAGGKAGKDSCRGDSGGPLMKQIPDSPNWYLEGVVSYGPTPCGKDGVPGVYTRVLEYMGWLADNMKP